jgi:large subunit ribosomal protein L18
MTQVNHTLTATDRRERRVRGRIRGTAQRPRVSVHRSNKHISVQAINDDLGRVFASASSQKLKKAGTKTETAVQVAQVLAEQLKKSKIVKAVFDRGSYRYHGRVRAVAEALRSAGIQV